MAITPVFAANRGYAARSAARAQPDGKGGYLITLARGAI
jgi:hypothetical protein